jgi:hypothetical protein
MKFNLVRLATLSISLALPTWQGHATTLYVDLNCTDPTTPFSGWNTAANTIQDAIDAASDGDLVLVTNGTYQTGGVVMAGDLTNRVALTKAISVQSVNGPWTTAILGASATNGTTAVRCAWLTNGASLIGFTLMEGATRKTGDAVNLQSGGAAWCASSNALIGDCLIVSNTAAMYGGGIYLGFVYGSLVSSNGAGNAYGGATYKSVLNNCTVVSNAIFGAVGPFAMTNCILYYNMPGNYSAQVGTAFSHCCATPPLPGTGNFANPPQLFADGVHLATNSPCIGAGIGPVPGTDIFGNVWSNPPAIGCAQWLASPIVTAPKIQLTGDPVGFTLGNVVVGGNLAPGSFTWLKDNMPLQDNGHFSGTQSTNLIATGVSFADAGNYQVIVSNSFGVATSPVTPLVIHCVDAAGTNPIAPYLDWATAATNIQDAIAASAAGNVVLVTNGLYASGGKSMDGIITNRVSIDKAILLQSVNGASTTIIQGAWDPISTNGPQAIRCAWMTNNAIMKGFMLTGGATRSFSNPSNKSMYGGGILGNTPLAKPTTNAVVWDCVIATNTASYDGGGAYSAALIRCTVIGNSAFSSGFVGSTGGAGGGAGNCSLRNCLITLNSSYQGQGGGVDGSSLTNCAVIRNSSQNMGSGANNSSLVNCTVTANSSSSAAVYASSLVNCIVFGNIATIANINTNYLTCTLVNCCADPLPDGTGNINMDPQILADDVHLAETSPCIGAGNPAYAMGTDLDGQPWNNPPSIGCDEWQPAPVISAQPGFQIGLPAHGLTLGVVVAGQAPFSFLWSKDGVPIQSDEHHQNVSTPTLAINNFGPDDAGNYQVVVTNSVGAVTSAVVKVVIHAVNVANLNPLPPYASWAVAANNIQDAIDASSSGDIVLVTNGIYSTGGMVMAGDLTNRVTLNKAITVISVNGYKATTIQGAWDSVTTNGPGAVRCAWVGYGATLSGFTLQNGATRATGDASTGGALETGGGAYCASTAAFVFNCLFTNNSAIYGGGIGNGTLNNSLAVENMANYGGGAYYAILNNCTIKYNFATAPSHGAGIYSCAVRNSIILGNFSYPFLTSDNYPTIGLGVGSIYYSCTDPLPSRNINIDANPGFLDSFHIMSTSPCFGTGSATYASGFDLDDEPWNNPPSMGCDEVVVSNLVGALAVNIVANSTNLLVNQGAFFSGIIDGHASWVAWNYGDGVTITNSGAVGVHLWTSPGDYTVTFTAYNADNPAGISATVIIHVAQPLNRPQLQSIGTVAGAFQFEFTGQNGANYAIQYTTDLSPTATWQTLQTIMGDGSLVQISDPITTNGERFYRVLVQ